jgi:hypothetical protein
VFCHHFCSVIPVLPPFSFIVLCFSFSCSVILMFYHHFMFSHSHSLFCLSHFHVMSSFYVLSFSFFILSFSFPPPAKPVPIPIPPYSPHLAKIKKKHMSSRGFKLVTSQANAKSSYCYTTCVFMSASMTGNTSFTKLTCYPCTMRSSR